MVFELQKTLKNCFIAMGFWVNDLELLTTKGPFISKVKLAHEFTTWYLECTSDHLPMNKKLTEEKISNN